MPVSRQLVRCQLVRCQLVGCQSRCCDIVQACVIQMICFSRNDLIVSTCAKLARCGLVVVRSWVGVRCEAFHLYRLIYILALYSQAIAPIGASCQMAMSLCARMLVTHKTETCTNANCTICIPRACILLARRNNRHCDK